MDIVDRDLEKAEKEATREGSIAPADGTAAAAARRRSMASRSMASVSSASVVREEMNIDRVITTRDLERHPTALSRIQTQRSQHSGTVGRTLTSRQPKNPLPEFGGGKPYPPQLPDQEEYVVEFDGPNDPLHPQNWPMNRK